MMWFPEYLKHQGSHTGNDTLGHLMPAAPSSGYVYKESMYVALGALPGNILSILITDKVGPKLLLCEYIYIYLLYYSKGFTPKIKNN